MTADPLDIEQPDALAGYLRSTGRIGADEQITIRTLAGGVSNRTVLVERPSGEGWVLKQALPKLRVAVDWFSDPARIRREALGLRYLEQLAPPGSTTPLVFEDPDRYLLAMRAVPQPHENWKGMLLRGHIASDSVLQFAESSPTSTAAHGRGEMNCLPFSMNDHSSNPFASSRTTVTPRNVSRPPRRSFEA